MKKHDEGYALVLVLVVITVLCLVAMAMMAASLKNLTNQQSSIERMQAKYDAQGEIEKVIANLEANYIDISSGTPVLSGFDVEDLDILCQDINVTHGGTLEYGEKKNDEGDVVFEYLAFTVTSGEYGSLKIKCTIHLIGDVNDQDLGDGKKHYSVTDVKWKYDSYTMVQGGESDGN